MSSVDPLANVEFETLLNFGRHIKAKVRSSMRRDTLIVRIKSSFDNDVTFITHLNEFTANQDNDDNDNDNNNDNNNANANPPNTANMNIDEEEDEHNNDDEKNAKQEIPIQLFLSGSATVIKDTAQQIPAPVMDLWMKRKFKPYVYATDTDRQTGALTDITIQTEVPFMDKPNDAKHDFAIKKIFFDGKRYDGTARFKRTGDAKKDRQFGTNQYQSLISKANTSASKNGAHFLVLGSDTTTRAYIELSGGRVQRNGCMMKIVGTDIPGGEEFDTEMEKIWTSWIKISDLMLENKREIVEKEMEADKKAIQKQTGNIATKQKKLLDDLLSETIDQTQFAEQMEILTKSLLQTANQ